MIREIEKTEKDRIRELLAKLEYEDQKYYRKRPKSLDQLLAEKKRSPISDKVVGRNVIYVAEVEGRAVGLCWCVVYDWGAGKDGAIEEFYVESKYRGMGLGTELLMAARKLFVDKKVDVAGVWEKGK